MAAFRALSPLNTSRGCSALLNGDCRFVAVEWFPFGDVQQATICRETARLEITSMRPKCRRCAKLSKSLLINQSFSSRFLRSRDYLPATMERLRVYGRYPKRVS